MKKPLKFICTQKINFILHTFLEILQTCHLGTLGSAHPKWYYQHVGNFHVYQLAKIKFIPHVFLEILQKYCKLFILDTLDMSGHAHPKWYYHNVRDFHVYLQAKDQLHPPYFSGDIAKILFWEFGHVWLCTPKMIVSIHTKLHCLSACQKKSLFTSFLRYYTLKNPAIWLANSILDHNSRTRILLGIYGEILITILVFILDYCQEKLLTKVFKKPKNVIIHMLQILKDKTSNSIQNSRISSFCLKHSVINMWFLPVFMRSIHSLRNTTSQHHNTNNRCLTAQFGKP